jgi:hypothetical protein
LPLRPGAMVMMNVGVDIAWLHPRFVVNPWCRNVSTRDNTR